MVVHTFGDSHCHNGFQDVPDVRTHPLGPKLCHSVGRDGISIKVGYDVQNADTVIFCFGEIDCRCHVRRYLTESQDYKTVIDAIVRDYFLQLMC